MTSTDAGSVTVGGNTASFSQFQNLAGSGGNDGFTVNASLTGSIDGGTGADSLAGTLIDVVTLTGSGAYGFAGTESDVGGGFSNIDVLTGTGISASLTGENIASTWTINGASSSYNDGSNSLTISGFNTLNGGNSADIYTVSGASTFNLAGGAGVDTFTVNANLTGTIDGGAGADTINVGNGITISGPVSGGTGTDTLNFSAVAGATNVALTAAGTNDGVQGIDDVIGSGTSGGTLTGSAGNDTFGVTGTDAGSVTVGSNTVTFSQFQNLAGGAGNDTFIINAALTGSVNGGTGADILAGTLIDAVTLTGSTADGYAGNETDISGGFSNIDVLTGNAGSLTGENVSSTWTVNGAGTSTYDDGGTPTNTLTISGFSTLIGGSNADGFNVTGASTVNLAGGAGNDAFTVNAPLTGSIDGGTGTDTVSGTLIDAVTLTSSGANGFSGTESDVSLGFSNINAYR